MKNIHYIIFLIFLIGCSGGCNPELNQYGLFGEVKSVKEIRIRVEKLNDGLEKLDTILISVKKYDDNGFLVRDSIKMNDNYFIGKHFYNSDGLLIKEVGKMNIQQNETTVDYFYSGKKIIKTKGYTKEHKGDFDIEYFQIEDYIYKDDELIECVQNSYLVNSKNKDTTITSGYTSKFDENQLVIELDCNIIDSLFPEYKYQYFRNSDGLIIKEKSTNKIDNTEKTFVYKYDYDEQGNWIGKSKFENDTIIELTKRIIEYK
jgi:hypothetical protein